MGKIFKAELEKIKSPLIKEVRGRGLFIGVEIKEEEGIKVNGNHFAKMFFKHGVLTKATHDSTVRLTPPLVITESEIMNLVEVTHRVVADLEQYNSTLQ
jgi:ornithine--oxo-acid transaminase